MIEALLIALLKVAVVVVIGYVVNTLLRQLPGLPPIVQTLVWAAVVLLSLLIVWQAVVSIDFDSP